MKTPVFTLPEATVYLEEFAGLTWGHCDVTKWTPGVAKALRRAWFCIVESHGGPIYALHTPGDSKHAKWCELFGFKFFIKSMCDDGNTREVWVCHGKET